MAITLLYAIRMRPSIGPASLVWPSAWLSLAMIGLAGLGLLVAPASELLRASWPLWLLLLVYVGGSYIMSRGEYSRDGAHPAPGLRQQFKRTWKLLLEMVGLGLVIALAMNYLVSSAETIATQTGLGETFVGTLLMALVTSLPELAAGLAAARMGLLDMAIGNYLGSNALNMALLLVADLAFEGSLLANVSLVNLVTVASVVLMTFVLMSIRQLLATSLGSRWRWAGGLAFGSLGLYIIALALIFSLGARME
jgi:cation:H+ antiporter